MIQIVNQYWDDYTVGFTMNSLVQMDLLVNASIQNSTSKQDKIRAKKRAKKSVQRKKKQGIKHTFCNGCTTLKHNITVTHWSLHLGSMTINPEPKRDIVKETLLRMQEMKDIRTKKDNMQKIQQELMAVALHPKRMAQWIDEE